MINAGLLSSGLGLMPSSLKVSWLYVTEEFTFIFSEFCTFKWLVVFARPCLLALGLRLWNILSHSTTLTFLEYAIKNILICEHSHLRTQPNTAEHSRIAWGFRLTSHSRLFLRFVESHIRLSRSQHFFSKSDLSRRLSALVWTQPGGKKEEQRMKRF